MTPPLPPAAAALHTTYYASKSLLTSVPRTEKPSNPLFKQLASLKKKLFFVPLGLITAIGG